MICWWHLILSQSHCAKWWRLQILSQSHCSKWWHLILSQSHCSDWWHVILSQSHCSDWWHVILSQSHCSKWWLLASNIVQMCDLNQNFDLSIFENSGRLWSSTVDWCQRDCFWKMIYSGILHCHHRRLRTTLENKDRFSAVQNSGFSV